MQSWLPRHTGLALNLYSTLSLLNFARPCSCLPAFSIPSCRYSTNAGSAGKHSKGSATERAAEAMEGAAEEAVQRLHPAFTKFINSGYMESQRQLRDRLLDSEWQQTVRAWALAQGLADFEKYIVEKGQESGLEVSWEVMQQLYANPEDLSPLSGNERARLLAQAFITQALVKQQVEVYKACTETAKQLANVIESGQRTGASTLLSAVRRLLPLPFLK